ncbi:hypothetical protein GUITHDRAFT_86883 [Guillardia theta CCMP2712]|uniref:protein-tyrosine-phosphatase n=2 Tax=Guillardia theta TaxID=55529 RepID=L1JDA7_GUITC|nr:hypothetical protein GUITHDRAFT_86883 [Guillardia theta CCMP2712]EKX46104.1 hypothetical protein GUITHDRAFT_86883 [Guillardia theta CCMP2712]|eukprot:XP_005833084.1 hypothetical protein GUITHDRAFT_86883 [Guillardia theta CCMP2712]
MAQQFREFVQVKEQEKKNGQVKPQLKDTELKAGKQSQEQALKEADDLLDAFAPPKSKKAADPDDSQAAPAQDAAEEEEIPLASVFSPDAGTQEDRDSVSCIVAGKLYLTNFRGVERTDELKKLNIRHIVCVNEQNNEFPDQFNYFNIDTLEDQEDHDATVHFSAVKKFTDESLAKGGAVCFHCAAGISRSTTMMIAYLMASNGMSLFDAFRLTYSRRRVAWPNRSFMQQLIQYETKLQKEGVLHGKHPSIELEDWDMWTTGDMQRLREQHLISLESRHDSLKGADSRAYREYSEKLQKALQSQLA